MITCLPNTQLNWKLSGILKPPKGSFSVAASPIPTPRGGHPPEFYISHSLVFPDGFTRRLVIPQLYTIWFCLLLISVAVQL